MNFKREYMARIPASEKREFIKTACRTNFLRMIVMAVFTVFFDLILAFLIEDFRSETFYLSVGVAALNLLFLPILFYLYSNIEISSTFTIMLVQSIFVSGLILCGIFWSLFEQEGIASNSTYMLAILAISAFIIIPPFISAILLAASFFAFMGLLSHYQTDVHILQTLNINTFSMTVFAWVLNQMASREAVNSFINKKAVLEKNLELKKKNIELKELTMKDSMTGLLNHKNSLKRLKEEVDRARRIDYSLSVAMIDLDNFKIINDSFGHQSGDEILTRFAGILKEGCRNIDIVGRYGGEEFLIIMPDTNSGEAALLLNRIRVSVEGASFREGISLTFSGGISELNGESVHGLLKISDMMLYEAKRKGKNRIEVFDDNRKSAAVN